MGGVILIKIFVQYLLTPIPFLLTFVTPILFFLISVAIVGIGLIGEYVGRIYQVVQARPKYIIKETIGFDGK